MAGQLVYYKSNVKYPIVVRQFIGDTKGELLTNLNTHVSTPLDNLRAFKMANKDAILEGAIIPTEEPSIDWETPNSLSTEDMTELLKNYAKLKSTLSTITSGPIITKLLDLAKEQNKSGKTIALIQVRNDELNETDEISLEDMQGVV